MTLILKSAPMVDQKITNLKTLLKKLPKLPKLLIIRDSENPVIEKYVKMKQKFGENLGITVEDFLAKNPTEISEKISAANADNSISGLIVQLPLESFSAPSQTSSQLSETAETSRQNPSQLSETAETSRQNPSQLSETEILCQKIAPEKDVDGLNDAAEPSYFLPATAKAILDLLEFYHIDLKSHKIAIVGRGKLVGAPLLKELKRRNLPSALFHRGSDLEKLKNFDLVITATGVPALIKSDFISPGTILVDAGTASEKGILKGDLSPDLYDRTDLTAITPHFGGVGPATVSCLFENLLSAALRNA